MIDRDLLIHAVHSATLDAARRGKAVPVHNLAAAITIEFPDCGLRVSELCKVIRQAIEQASLPPPPGRHPGTSD